MCDQDHFEKDRQEYQAGGLVTRRQFGVLLGAGMAMMLPQVANAVAVTESDVNVMTPDGTADCYFVHPATGTAPGVLIWPDIFGLRPAFRQMGKRLAENGYAVLVVNPFYRVKKAPTADAGAATPIPQLMPLAQGLTNPDSMCIDAGGNVYVGVNAGLLVLRPDGSVVTTVPSFNSATQGITNCGFGGADGTTLYFTSWNTLWRIDDMPIPGLDWQLSQRMPCN